jgi:hypothetical protein
VANFESLMHNSGPAGSMNTVEKSPSFSAFSIYHQISHEKPATTPFIAPFYSNWYKDIFRHHLLGHKN